MVFRFTVSNDASSCIANSLANETTNKISLCRAVKRANRLAISRPDDTFYCIADEAVGQDYRDPDGLRLDFPTLLKSVFETQLELYESSFCIT